MRKTSTYARKRRAATDWERERHQHVNPVKEARILAGTANALADIAETPAELERQRGAVIAGLLAIDRLMPKLHTFSLAAGSLELDNLLHTANGLGTADVRRALGMQA